MTALYYIIYVVMYGSRSVAGRTISLGDGFKSVSYLRDRKAGEMVEFPNSGIKGMVLNLERDSLSWVVFGSDIFFKKFIFYWE